MSAHVHLVEHDHGSVTEVALGGLTAARALASAHEARLHAVVVEPGASAAVDAVTPYAPDVVHVVSHELLTDYGPDAWAEALSQVASAVDASVVTAAGTDRGNETLAHVGAIRDAAMVANCLEVESSEPGAAWQFVRVRWGGSLHERARLDADVKLFTFAPHSTEPVAVDGAPPPDVAEFSPTLGERAATTLVRERVTVEEGLTLATAPVVVAGGRGVGGEDGFAILEELAGLLGGAVGCSRVVTNNGWRPHSDQVGQTGTVVAPDLYVACGISGAIQHWVGMMNSKHILAINTDADAPMVAKADWAVVGDLHEVVPAVVDEIRSRRG